MAMSLPGSRRDRAIIPSQDDGACSAAGSSRTRAKVITSRLVDIITSLADATDPLVRDPICERVDRIRWSTSLGDDHLEIFAGDH